MSTSATLDFRGLPPKRWRWDGSLKSGAPSMSRWGPGPTRSYVRVQSWRDSRSVIVAGAPDKGVGSARMLQELRVGRTGLHNASRCCARSASYHTVSLTLSIHSFEVAENGRSHREEVSN